MSRPVVYTYHVLYAEDVQGVAAIMENVIGQGVDEVKARLIDGHMYVIEYKLPRDDQNEDN